MGPFLRPTSPCRYGVEGHILRRNVLGAELRSSILIRRRQASHSILQIALQFIQFFVELILASNHQPHEDEDDGEGQAVGSKREL